MKYRSLCRLSGALITMMLLASACAGGKAGAGALHIWPEGTTVVYEMVRGQDQTIEIPGQGYQETSTSTTFVVSVEAVGEREFKVEFLEASGTSSSNDPGQVVGLESTVRLDERGVITEATGLEENPYVRGRGGIELFKDDLQNLFLYLPEGPMTPGLEWSREYSFAADQQGLIVQRTHSVTYRCVEEMLFDGTNAFEIKFTSKIKFAGKGDQGGGEMEVEVGGAMEGTIYVDTANGMILSQEVGGELEGLIVTQDYDLPALLKTSLTVKRKK